jgi:short-subunit dehydrogenase
MLGRRAPAQIDPALRDAASYCRVDLGQPSCAPLVRHFLQTRGITRLDLLIHNAAIGYYGPTAAQEPHAIGALLAVNLRAPLSLTHTLLPWLQQARGKLVFISSVVSALPGPEYAVYTASKAALDGLARSLRTELRREGVAVQCIYPGATRTSMHARSGAPLDKLGWQRFPPPEKVAARIARAIDSSRESVTIGAGNRLLQLAGRHAPGIVDSLLRRRSR